MKSDCDYSSKSYGNDPYDYGSDYLEAIKSVFDYKGDIIRLDDAVWCEYDKQWCKKSEAIWIDYMHFYTTPEYRHKLKDLVTEYNIKNKEEIGKGRIRWYKNGKLEE